ncbi:MAG: SUF system NifU family Fe-S cluster assembly protein [Armatimonadetes bacterium]|nr:SUF system NifU family Fe-S cluster assembly protein [Armatimonadota bacterium]
MSDLRDLYQEVILDHSRRPRNFRRLNHANHRADGYNALCGDRITVYLQVEDGHIKDITFDGSGCAISKASASMMTAALKGKTIEEAQALFDKFHRMVTGESDSEVGPVNLGKLAAFAGICDYPSRVKCASLAWHTVHAALEDKNEVVSTE